MSGPISVKPVLQVNQWREPTVVPFPSACPLSTGTTGGQTISRDKLLVSYGEGFFLGGGRGRGVYDPLGVLKGMHIVSMKIKNVYFRAS